MKVTDILSSNDFVVTAELDPPLSPSIEPVIEDAKRLSGIVDAINVSERKVLRMNSILTATQIKEKTGIETIFHITCRDWSQRATFGLLLSAWSMGLKNVLAVFGDKDKVDGIYDFKSSFDIISFIKSLNEGIYDKEEKVGSTDFCIGAGVNPCGDKELEIEKLVKSVDSGINFVQTQPIYYPDKFFDFLDLAKESGIKIPIIPGVMPLKSSKSPEFLEKKLGIPVSPHIKKRMKSNSSEEGVRIAGEIIDELRSDSRGVHIYPMGNIEAAVKLSHIAKELSVEAK